VSYFPDPSGARGGMCGLQTHPVIRSNDQVVDFTEPQNMRQMKNEPKSMLGSINDQGLYLELSNNARTY